ncbi:MAG TPA: formate dehydrogenase accessory protein FdhE [Acidimicrobiales bacterium]|nr:formate dehydrogenase accessory protein FdhE [Acidimicrobiales bacterium]
MILGPRGGPGAFDVRLARAQELGPRAGAAAEPLTVLAAVIEHQRARAAATRVVEAAAIVAGTGATRTDDDRFPLLDLEAAIEPIAGEVALAVEALAGMTTSPLAEAGQRLSRLDTADQTAMIEAWLEEPSLAEPQHGFWIGIAAAPILERAAGSVDGNGDGDGWRGAVCPACGGMHQVSVIAEESGEFMGGSPRSLVCSRCATWWNFTRATCVYCGEQDPRRLPSFVADGQRCARVDACESCHRYTKTFDLRAKGSNAVIPLVDDVATLTLDVWARDRGFSRAAASLAGV